MNIERELKRIQKENRLWEEEYAGLQKLNLKALEFEKSGRLEEAIDAHKECIAFSTSSSRINNANHYLRNIDRMLVLYRKLNMFKEEVELLEFTTKKVNSLSNNKYVKRLERAKELLLKTTS